MQLSSDPQAAPARRNAHAEYRPRDPESTILHQVVREYLETFLASATASGRRIPRFVERELRGFLECGILAHGFVRVHCDECGHDRVVAFSCKGRAFCPSCGGRRMADTAAPLVDRVLPQVAVRQWVLTLPFPLRLRMAYDARLASDVLAVFLRAVMASVRRRARRERPIRHAHGGAVTVIQRFGDALNLNVHFHALVLDGVYEAHPSRRFRFHALPPPRKDELGRVLRRIATRLQRLLERRGLDADLLLDESDEPLLPFCAASLRHRSALGPRAGHATRRRGDRIDPEDVAEPDDPYCVQAGAMSLHAGVAVPAPDRARLERLGRYILRPPVATRRLERLPDGNLLYRLKRRWRDGTTHVVFEPMELLERLVSLVPPPRAHQVRYHGVLAPCASRRSDAVPIGLPPDEGSSCAAGFHPDRSPAASPATSADAEPTPSPVAGANADGTHRAPRPRRLAWSELMKRVFAIDVLACPRCGSNMRILAAIHDPVVARAILECLHLPSRPPPNLPAAPPPDLPIPY